MPNVLIGSFKAAEADASTQQALTTPHVTGCHLQFPHPLGFGVVHLKFDRFLHIGFEEVFQQVTFFILEKQRNMDDSSCDSAETANQFSCLKKRRTEIIANCKNRFSPEDKIQAW